MSPSTINTLTNVVAFILAVWEPVYSYMSSQPFNVGTFVPMLLGAVVAYFTGKSTIHAMNNPK